MFESCRAHHGKPRKHGAFVVSGGRRQTRLNAYSSLNLSMPAANRPVVTLAAARALGMSALEERRIAEEHS